MRIVESLADEQAALTFIDGHSVPYSQPPVASWRLPKPLPVIVAQSCGGSATTSSMRNDANSPRWCLHDGDRLSLQEIVDLTADLACAVVLDP